MCGIFGYSGVTPIGGEKLAQLMVNNFDRGKDSSGYVYRDQSGFLLLDRSTKITEVNMRLAEIETDLVIGHTRSATIGEVNDVNAHPIPRNGKYLTHNGTVISYKEDAKELGLDLIKTVDSDVWAALWGACDSIEEFVDKSKKVSGDACIAALDSNTNQLLLFKRGNPLYLCWVEGGLLYTSVEKHFNDVIEDDKLIINMPINTWMLIENGNIIKGGKLERIYRSLYQGRSKSSKRQYGLGYSSYKKPSERKTFYAYCSKCGYGLLDDEETVGVCEDCSKKEMINEYCIGCAKKLHKTRQPHAICNSCSMDYRQPEATKFYCKIEGCDTTLMIAEAIEASICWNCRQQSKHKRFCRYPRCTEVLRLSEEWVKGFCRAHSNKYHQDKFKKEKQFSHAFMFGAKANVGEL